MLIILMIRTLENKLWELDLEWAPYRLSSKGRGLILDMQYTMSRDYAWSWSDFNWQHNAISNWQGGLAVGFWIESILKIQYDYSWNTQLGHIVPDDTPSEYRIYNQVSFIYNRNGFR